MFLFALLLNMLLIVLTVRLDWPYAVGTSLLVSMCAIIVVGIYLGFIRHPTVTTNAKILKIYQWGKYIGETRQSIIVQFPNNKICRFGVWEYEADNLNVGDIINVVSKGGVLKNFKKVRIIQPKNSQTPLSELNFPIERLAKPLITTNAKVHKKNMFPSKPSGWLASFLLPNKKIIKLDLSADMYNSIRIGDTIELKYVDGLAYSVKRI